MRRREFIVSVVAAATLVRGAGAQPKPKLARLGWVVGASAASSVPFLDSLRAGLANLGYVEGRNLAIETRYADDKPDLVAPLARGTYSPAGRYPRHPGCCYVDRGRA